MHGKAPATAAIGPTPPPWPLAQPPAYAKVRQRVQRYKAVPERRVPGNIRVSPCRSATTASADAPITLSAQINSSVS